MGYVGGDAHIAPLISGNTVLGTTSKTRPAEFARASLSALGLQTPLFAFSCTCNVDFQDISCADGLCCYYGVCHAKGLLL